MKKNQDQTAGKSVTESLQQESSPSEPSARSAQRSGGGSAGVELDTRPSNTVSNNCNIDYFKALRWGVDSLYLSFHGKLLPEVDSRLTALKLLAQSVEPVEQCQAQYPLDEHLFEVKNTAPRGFAFLLEDNAFRIQLSRSKKLPAAYVKISSDYLAHVGPEQAGNALHALIDQLITRERPVKVSRIDCFVDFVWSGDMEWKREAWVTRASGIDAYSENGIFTGWVIGRGSAMSARLYNKLLQIAKVGADYLPSLWQAAGWRVGEHVWRLEFQLRREVLVQQGLTSLDVVLGNLNGLWSYATTEWLKLTMPNPDDQTRSRWPIHPLWGYLSSVDWESNGGALKRKFTNARLPEDKKLFSMALSVLVSYMAREKIEDRMEGYHRLMSDMYSFHKGNAERAGLNFELLLDQKLGIKGRQYNTILNKEKALAAVDKAALDQKAAAYLSARDGF